MEADSAGDPLFIPRVLFNEALEQARAGRGQDAMAALDGVRERCDDQPDSGQARLLAARALSVQAWWLLRDDRVDEALEISNQLVERLRTEADAEVQAAIGETLLSHTRPLLRVGALEWTAVARNLLIAATGAVGEGARRLARRLGIDRSRGLRGRWRPPGMPTAFTATRKRAAQARVVCGALVGCFGTAPEADKQRMVANARIYDAAAAVLLGHVVEGVRGFDVLVDSGQEAVAEAFRTQAETLQGDRGFIAEWGAISNLFHRARTLGQGDPRITRMAYEESVRGRESASRTTRWLTRLLAPGKK